LGTCKRTGPGKYSLRRRRRTTDRFALILVLSLATATATAQDATGAGGAAALDDFLASVETFRARFEQELWSADQQLLETSAGELWLRRPNRFRWHYVAPFEQLVVADGARLWMYDIELEQVTVASLDETGGPSPAQLLSGDESVRDAFAVTAEFEYDGLAWVRLEPRSAGTDFSAVLAGFRDGALELIELVDGLDQVTRIEFSDAATNLGLDQSLFEFEPPPGVDVLGLGR
jgi:outer membrane lipoprotein carrier protein